MNASPRHLLFTGASGFIGSAFLQRFAARTDLRLHGVGDTVLFPRIIRAARRGRLPLIGTGRAPAVRDLIYIETLCDYLLTLALKDELRGSYNLTNNKPVAIQEFLLDAFARFTRQSCRARSCSPVATKPSRRSPIRRGAPAAIRCACMRNCARTSP